MRLPPNHLIPRTALDDETLIKVADRFGTPLFAYDGDRISSDYRALGEMVPEGAEIFYSVKANPALAVLAQFAELGAGFEICSRGELAALKAAGADPGRALYVGPGKSGGEIEEAISAGVGFLVVESLRELVEAEAAAKRLDRRQKALLRLNPGWASGDQQMSGATQFGMDMDSAHAAIEISQGLDFVSIDGVHGFMGTRLLAPELLAANACFLLNAAHQLQKKTGAKFPTVDMGGGFGVPLYEGEAELDAAEAGAALSAAIEDYRGKNPWTRRVLVESGRYLVARSGVFLTKVIDVKKMSGRFFAVTDGGIHAIGGRDGYIGARATPMRLVGKEVRGLVETTVCGPLCTPADRLASRIALPDPKAGDLLALYMSGAYGPTASAGFFLSRGFPAEVMVKSGRAELIRKATTPECMFEGQRAWGSVGNP